MPVPVERTTLLAFAGIVVFGGLNALAVKVSNAELAPYWGAALRFAAGATVVALIAAWRRTPLPRGRALLGSAIFGVINFTVFFGLLYHALLSVPAGLSMVLLALAPLLTILFAAVAGQERLRLRGLAGGAMAVAGIALIFRERVGGEVPLASALMVVGGAASIALASVVVKGFPRVDAVANNVVAMTVGAAGLFALSAMTGEPWQPPIQPETWGALAYLVVLGSVALFVLMVYVIGRWTASAAAYGVVLMPLITVPVAAVVAGESLSPAFLLGGAIVLAGVYAGTLARSFARRSGASRRADTAAPPTLASPGCP